MINPYTIIGGLLLLIAVAFGGAHVGKKLERESWQKKEIALLAQAQDDLTKEFQRYERMVKFNEAKSVKAADDHAKTIQNLKTQHDATVAGIRRTGGLRLPGTVCKAPNPGASATPGAVESDDATAGTVRIPERVEERLFGIAEDADRLAEQLRSLQKWIRDNGLYGPPPEN